MLIGGQAVLLHGEPRLTLDVDVTLGVSPESLGTVLAACKAMAVDPLPETVEDSSFTSCLRAGRETWRRS